MSTWQIILSTFRGSFIGAGVVASLTQNLIERRERRNRRYDLQLKVCESIIRLIIDFEELFGQASPSGKLVELPMQKRKIRIRHRLRMVMSEETISAYDAYTTSAVKQVWQDLAGRPSRDETDGFRNGLLARLATELRVDPGWGERFWRQFDDCFRSAEQILPDNRASE